MMKKFLLVSLLCFAPIFTTHAADLTVEDCETLTTFIEESIKPHGNPVTPKEGDVSFVILDALRVKNEWSHWIGDNEALKKFQEPWMQAVQYCRQIKNDSSLSEKQKDLLLKQATLAFQLSFSNYKTAETRARMPFVHDGNVLPGPSRDEDGSFYVEQKFIPKFVNGSLIFLMSLSILMVIVGGLMFLFSSGDSDLTARAKTTIIWAIVGVILTILAYAIVQFIIGIDFSL